MLRRAKELSPAVGICVGAGHTPWQIVDRAIAIGAKKVQLFKPHFDQAMIDKAHANGIRCNVFWADDPEEARKYFEMGIDTVLTNDYLMIREAVKK
jgi:glycerophosphoryl diester phosphodiesterase